ncbi:MalY/PatB family protein [Lapidilactobacillus bayanensis]|uniref:MalY/PatB family protein n=1 Tax=Lapidilactobacillus bayanensis TaxID=2485998 RepID=UPI001CDB78CE|nr:PatB family C-S lyase [Lapidilactobacillus bayanensis]
MVLTPSLQEFIQDHLVDRQHTDSLKWDALAERFGDPSLLPLWVADMEFKTPLAVRQALIQQVEHGVFGYSLVPDQYINTFIAWQQKRHQVTLQADWLRFDQGVVNSLYAMVNWLTKLNDQVLIMTPVYYPFINSIKDNHRQVVSVDLIAGDNGWQIDFDRFEAVLSQGQIKLFILCSPHNPVGRIWTATELEQILALCHRYHVPVVADEIHQDFEIGSQKFTSVLTIANGRYQNEVVVLNAPSKTFNLASLLNSHVIIPNPEWRQQYDTFIKTIHQTENSLLGQIAGQAAYEFGGPWLDQLLQVIRYNYQTLTNTLADHCPEIQVSTLEGTYLSYLNLAPLIAADHIQDFVQRQCGLAVDYGRWFSPRTPTYIRLNLATDPAIVATAAEHLATQLALLR